MNSPAPTEPTVTVEFLVEPFAEGAPGPHVTAALAAVDVPGVAVEVGPFGTAVRGPLATVTSSVAELLRAAVLAGATRVQLQLLNEAPRTTTGEPR